jgi:crotonobetainyl-CoA:carnitine CoA-transferase CaiB-like acyl-CoA transferase
VILSITGFGHDGPEGGRAGYDQIAQGEGGLMSITGETEPTKVGAPIADLLAGMYGAYGALAALHERSITGKGRVVRTSLLASVVGVHAFHGTKWTVAHELPERVGNHHAQIAPYGLYRTQDDIVQVAIGSEGLWRLFAPIVALDPADERFATNSQRVAHRDELTAAIEGAFATDHADVWLQRLADKGIPAGKVRDFQQVYDWDQARSQGLLIDVEHPTLGAIQLPGPPLRFDDNQYAGARETNLPPPRLGEHNESVRAWLESE